MFIETRRTEGNDKDLIVTPSKSISLLKYNERRIFRSSKTAGWLMLWFCRVTRRNNFRDARASHKKPFETSGKLLFDGTANS